MSELLNIHDDRAVIRWRLLASASALALVAAASSSGVARAEDADRPSVWLEVGGQVTFLEGTEQQYTPPFLSMLPTSLPDPTPAQRMPARSADLTGRISFVPGDSGWVFSAGVRYGRSSVQGRISKVLPAYYLGIPNKYARVNNYVHSEARENQSHAILDFQVGKDVGLGMFGGTSVLSAGLRAVQFSSNSSVDIGLVPDFQINSGHNIFTGTEQAQRSFHGMGPEISWDGFAPLAGDTEAGQLTLDWGVNAAILFGRRTTSVHHQTAQTYAPYSGYASNVYTTSANPKRSRRVTVPNLGGFAGVSVRYPNAKISIGYRADEFFGAIDGGIDTEKKENRGFHGPYASISIGLP